MTDSNTTEPKILEPNVETKPTADIRLEQTDDGIVQTELSRVIPRPIDENDFSTPVKISDLKKIQDQVEQLQNKSINWEEISIGVATLGFGATLSALITPISLTHELGKLFYIFLPIISCSLTIYVIMHKIMMKRTETGSSNIIEDIIESYLDPLDKDKL